MAKNGTSMTQNEDPMCLCICGAIVTGEKSVIPGHFFFKCPDCSATAIIEGNLLKTAGQFRWYPIECNVQTVEKKYNSPSNVEKRGNDD